MANPTPVQFPFSPLDYDYSTLEAVDVPQFDYSTLEPVSVHPVERRRQDAQPADTEAGDVKAGKAIGNSWSRHLGGTRTRIKIAIILSVILLFFVIGGVVGAVLGSQEIN